LIDRYYRDIPYYRDLFDKWYSDKTHQTTDDLIHVPFTEERLQSPYAHMDSWGSPGTHLSICCLFRDDGVPTLSVSGGLVKPSGTDGPNLQCHGVSSGDLIYQCTGYALL
jgi:hypothetical protein